ncbi:hypothetical protein RFI_10523 [Reticulomyxa filosa]|uniref:Protein kinase domain-containing protein n=1 Tax=Reticulomyxa filosa TaxID=46433 RepID=X6NLL2_RETFI|nr:hypothetical protein RFI_10523 [Reticulomyxa filosa]|eukprot:ETO26614.1 hypothetical protein RFI_10523 [Reticulomyxa filosa]
MKCGLWEHADPLILQTHCSFALSNSRCRHYKLIKERESYVLISPTFFPPCRLFQTQNKTKFVCIFFFGLITERWKRTPFFFFSLSLFSPRSSLFTLSLFYLLALVEKHPYLANTHEVELSRDKNHLFIFQDLEKNGSLRDHIYGQDLSRPYDEKYSRPGQSLELNTIRRYGRQILEAMQYLSSCGIVNYHLHTGNVIVGTDGDVYLAGIENNFLGLLPKHPYHKSCFIFYFIYAYICIYMYTYTYIYMCIYIYLIQLKKLYPDLAVELCLFGYVLFEMASGIQCPSPSPLDSLHELPKKLPSPIIQILGRIFGDKSIGAAQRISDLMEDPLFVAKNAPPLDTQSYLTLRKENEHVEIQKEKKKRPNDAMKEPLLYETKKPRKGSDTESGLTVKDLLVSMKDEGLEKPQDENKEENNEEETTKPSKQQPENRHVSDESDESDEEDYFP